MEPFIATRFINWEMIGAGHRRNNFRSRWGGAKPPQQGSFFVGGRDTHSDTLSTLPDYAPSGTITVDQMYVRYQIPVESKGRPITLIHGCCLTAKTWETTPDGRMGWDEYFLRRGHAVYAVDQVARGRSAADPSVINSVKLGKTPPNRLPPVFSPAHEAAWANFTL